jgi:hypothetical protein
VRLAIVEAALELNCQMIVKNCTGLTSQLRRCSASIPANLAEGMLRNGDAEFARFCSIAMGGGERVGVSSAAGQGSEAHQAQGLRRTVAMHNRTETDAGLLQELNADR